MTTDTATPPLLTLDGAIATLRLNRPAQANRIEPGDLAVLERHFQDIAGNDQIRAVILTGTGKHFSAGYDLTALLATVEETPSVETALNPFISTVDRLEALPQPVICALNGGVYGGATDLALACDLRIAVPHVRMFMPAARLGLHYYLSGMRRYVSRLGLNTAKELFLFAQEMDAEAMHRTGFVNRIVPPECLMQVAREAAESVAALAPLAVRGMKAALNDLAHDRLDVFAFGRAETQCLCSADIREGVLAWQEKRLPHFTGR